MRFYTTIVLVAMAAIILLVAPSASQCSCFVPADYLRQTHNNYIIYIPRTTSITTTTAAATSRLCLAVAASSPLNHTRPNYPKSQKWKRKNKSQSIITPTTRTRIPRFHEEAVGISASLGLWRSRRKMRQILKETWNAFRTRQFGRRRKKLSMRVTHLFARDDVKSSSSGSSLLDLRQFHNSIVEEEEEDDEEEDEDETTSIESSLDAMRARAGVLRTRIRIRQESLSYLEKLTRDVKLELRRTGWKNVFDANAGFTKRAAFMYGQSTGKETSGGEKETDDVMNEFELAAINEKWKEQQLKKESIDSRAPPGDADTSTNVKEDNGELLNSIQLDRMENRSRKLKSSILLYRIRLQRLERSILCCENNELGMLERAVGNTLYSLNDIELFENNPITAVQRRAKKFINTFEGSTSVLLRKLKRISTQSGSDNIDYASVTDFVVQETAAGVRILGNLLSNPSQLSQLVDPDTPTLVPHVPAILARLDRLESHVAQILSRVLNNKQHLRSIEPYLEEILERFDDIEPHLPWILDHVDTLAPYTGLLLKHIDELLLYAKVDKYEAEDENCNDNYAFAEQLLPYLEVYVSKLDVVGPHLPLLRPHLPLLLKHNRIKILSPHVGVLFSKGYSDLSASANMDILLFYFGWALRIPFVPRIFFSLPGSPGMVSFLANRLPKRLVRGQCCDVSCNVDGDYGKGWNELSKS